MAYVPTSTGGHAELYPYLYQGHVFQPAGLVKPIPPMAPAAALPTSLPLKAYTSALADLTAVGGAAYDLYQAFQKKDKFNRALSVANLANQIAGATVVLAPFAALQTVANLQLGLAHTFFAKQEAKHAVRHAVRKVTRELVRLQNLGHNSVIAARLAAAARHIDPELIAPLGSPFANYSPRTGYSDTEIGLLLDFGEGDVPDAAREARARELEANLIGRPYPAPGQLPGPFVLTHRSA